MKTFITLLFSCAMLASIQAASLTFDNNRIVHEATLDETEYTAKFPFTNTGDTPVKILEVNSSCGCTTAMPSKTVFNPGESGEISATFDYGQREGKQIKSIRIETDEESDPRVFLTLEVNIPTALNVSPSVVMWNRSATTGFEPKEVTIVSSLAEPVEITEVVASSDNFIHEVKVLDEGRKFALAVTPQNIPTDSKGIIRGTFVVKTNFDNPLKGTLKVYAIVR